MRQQRVGSGLKGLAGGAWGVGCGDLYRGIGRASQRSINVLAGLLQRGQGNVQVQLGAAQQQQ